MNAGATFAIAAACGALAACATTTPPSPVLSISGENCSTTPDLSNATSLQVPSKPGDEKPTEVAFDDQSPCLELRRGAKSLYRAFALPTQAPAYTILVSSVPFGAGIFAPRVMLLDGQGKMTREVGADSFVFRGSELTTLLRNHAEERYLLVVSDPDALGKQFARTTGETQVYTGSTGYATFQIHTGTDTTRQLVYSANGKVSVTLAILPASEKPR